MPLLVRICLQNLKSKTFNISDNNFHLKSSFSGISGGFVIITREGLLILLNKIYGFLWPLLKFG